MSKSLDGVFAPFAADRGSALRHAAARSLHLASRVLATWAQQVSSAQAHERRTAPLVLEFHAEAGAPEGALYADGHLVGYLNGVTRL